MKNTLIIAMSLFAVTSVQASKVFMALIPTTGSTHAIVTVMEKSCTQAEGNALYMVGKVASMGCWKQDGDKIRVEWQSGDAPTSFNFDAFKLVSDDSDNAATVAKKRRITTHLNCTAEGWIGDLIVDRDEMGVLRKLTVSGEDVNFSEKGTAINFSYQGKNISLSTSTGIFNFETSGFQSYLNNRLLGGGNVKGTGSCKLSDGAKKF